MGTASGFYAQPVPHAPALTVSVERMRMALLWLTGCAGAFVFVEPSPYEIASMLTIIVFVVTGLTLRPNVMPLAFLLIIHNIGFSIAVVPVLNQPKTLMWVLVSWYMATTAVFFAVILADNTETRLRLLMKGYTAAALIASLAGIIGYSHAVPHLSELFLKYGRAEGTFNDPNVFGAFLVLPALVALQRVLSGRAREILRGGTLLMIFVIALLLSFSRAAWGQFVACAGIVMLLTFVTSASPRERLRLIVVATVGIVGMGLFVIALLSIDQVGALFLERASLEQSYDTGVYGRFGRHILGFLLALEEPFGIGPLQFAKMFPEDPHNTFLNAFMSGGWISGVCYIALTLVTLVLGFRTVFIRTPWRGMFIAVYAAFVGVAGESAIIDVDHWRHYYLILGVVWGLAIASRRYGRVAGARRADARLAPQGAAVTAVMSR